MNNAIKDANPRRAFFRWMARQSLLTFEEMRGRPQMRLNDLPALPSDEIATLQPEVLADVTIFTGNDLVLARLPGKDDTITLFPICSPELAIFNRFNGMNTLSDVAGSWRDESGLPLEQTFLGVRTLFLRMTQLGVCAPVNATGDPVSPAKTGTQQKETEINASPEALAPVPTQIGEGKME